MDAHTRILLLDLLVERPEFGHGGNQEVVRPFLHSSEIEVLLVTPQMQSFESGDKTDLNCDITLKLEDVPNWNVALKMINENNIKIHYGKDLTGNIYNIQNVLDYIIKVGKNTCSIVTADGGIDYSVDYNKQEQLSYRLILCEIVIALSIQIKNGIFIFKIFDLSTQFTLELLYILSKSYKEIIITKPNTSRMANSEKYVICKGFIGIKTSNLNILYKAVDVFEKEFPFSLVDGEIDKNFINLIMEYNSNYIKTQIDNINNTLEQVTHEDYILQIKMAYSWCNKYEISINKYNKYNKII